MKHMTQTQAIDRLVNLALENIYDKGIEELSLDSMLRYGNIGYEDMSVSALEGELFINTGKTIQVIEE